MYNDAFVFCLEHLKFWDLPLRNSILGSFPSNQINWHHLFHGFGAGQLKSYLHIACICGIPFKPAKSIGSRSLPSYLSNHHLSIAPPSSYRMVCTRVKHAVRQSLPPNPTQIICTARPTLSSLKPPKTLPRTSTWKPATTTIMS